MDSVFDFDSPLQSFIRKLADVFVVNILWLVCSIPIVTIGASTTAMYDVTLRLVREGDGYVFRSFFRAFRDNFRQSTMVWGIFVGLIIIWVVDFYFVMLVSTWNPMIRYLLMIFLLILALVWIIMLLYVFPIIARFENTTKEVMINAYVMSTGHLLSTAGMLMLNGLMLLAAFVWVPVLLGFCFGLGAFMNSFFLHKIFSKYICTAKENDHE